MKKVLSLIVCTLLVVSTIGIFSVAAENETVAKTVKVGEMFTLPTDIDGTAVTAWTDKSGAAVSGAVDTSKVGYKLYTGTTANGEITYRVNVEGEIDMLVADMEDYEIGSTPIATVGHSAQAGETVVYENGESGNKVLKASSAVSYPSGSNYSGLLLSQDYGKDFSISLKYKLSNGTKGSQFHLEPLGIAGNTSSDFGGPYLYIDSKTDVRIAIANFGDSITKVNLTDMKVNEDVCKYDGSTYADKDKIALDNGWIELKVNYKMQERLFDIYVQNEKIVYDIPFHKNATKTTVKQMGYRIGLASGETIMIDDIKFTRTAYVTDDLSTKSITGIKVPQGDNSPRTAEIALTMSDETTQTFTVNYTPDDTAVAGSIHTVYGTIDGFSETVPVTYTVTGTTYKTVNTYIGANITLPGVSDEIDTSVMGRKHYTGETDSGKVIYTVNTGRFDEIHSDEMETHETKPADETYAKGLIAGEVKDGFKLSTKMNKLSDATYYGSAISAEKDGDKAILYASDSGKTVNPNLTWNVIDTFDGSFRVSMDIKVENAGTQGYKPYIRFYDQSGNQITNGFGPRIVKSNKEKILAIRGNGDSKLTTFGQVEVAKVTKDLGYGISWTRNDGATADSETTKNSSDWFNLRVDVDADTKTYDVFVNDVLVVGDVGFAESNAVGNIGKITMAFRDNADADVYIDNLKIYQYNCFTDELPESVDVVVGQGEVAPQKTDVALTLSNGGLWKPEAMVNVDSSKLGVVSTTATIEGFDETVSANVKVCNYDVNTIAYKNGAEFATGASVGSTMSSAVFTNKSGIAGGKAVFAWYSKDGSIQVVKPVDIPEIAKDEAKTVDVGLKLPTESEKVVDGKLRVFIVDSFETLRPVDKVSEIDYEAPTAPTVHIAGASTFQTYDDYYFPRAGVGQVIENYFVDGVTVNNKAFSGRTTQTFIDEGYWDSILFSVKPGDYVITHFAHNDQKKCGEQSAALGETCVYSKNMKKFIDDVRAKGANIIMMTGISRRTEGVAGTAYYMFNAKNQEPHNHMTQLEKLSTTYDVPLVDMSALSTEYLQDLAEAEGEAATKKLYLQDISSAAGVYSDNISYYQASPLWAGSRFNTAVDANYMEETAEAHNDYTHFTIYGANVYADMLTDAIAEKYPTIELTQFIDVDAEPLAYPGF